MSRLISNALFQQVHHARWQKYYRLDYLVQTDLQHLVTLINEARQRAGVPTLTIHPSLETAARNYAATLARLDLAERSNHELDGKKPFGRAREAGYLGSYIGENIANFHKTAQQAMYGPGWCWMNSPGHRENILRPEFQHIGVANQANSKGQLYWVTVFGRP